MKKTGEERVRLGVVGVDSGQLMVVDPCYIDSEWRKSGESEVVAVEFWGLHQRQVRARLHGNPAVGQVRSAADGKFRVTPAEGHTHGDVAEAIERAREPDEVIVVAQHTTSSYDEVCEVSLNPRSMEEGGGQLNYKMGHPGLGVVFSSGFGDGTYEVFATVRDFGSWGRRIAKVEIVLVGDDEVVEDRSDG